MQTIDNVKNRLFSTFAVIVLILVAGFALSSPFIIGAIESRDGRRVVVVDAGHGGEDGGVTGASTGVKESELNLKVAKLLGEYLRAGGYKVVFTRVNDTMHSFPSVKDNKKRADMFKRGEIIKNASPDAVVSVHMNFYRASTRRGAQVFFDKGNEKSASLANVMQSVLNRDINSFGGREYSALSAEKYLLSCTPCPSIIVECGFLSNPIDEANLVKTEYQAQIAYTMFLGIDAFLKGEI